MLASVTGQMAGAISMIYVLSLIIMFLILYTIWIYMEDKDLSDEQNSYIDNFKASIVILIVFIFGFIISLTLLLGTTAKTSLKSKYLVSAGIFSVLFIIMMIYICSLILYTNDQSIFEGLGAIEIFGQSNDDPFNLFITVTVYCAYIVLGLSIVAVVVQGLLTYQVTTNKSLMQQLVAETGNVEMTPLSSSKISEDKMDELNQKLDQFMTLLSNK